MPQLRKLAPEEVQAIENKGKPQRKITEEQYDAFLADYAVGDYGEAELDADEKRLSVRNRFKAAATRRAVGIEFKRTTGNTLRFWITELSNGNSDGNKNGAAPAAIFDDTHTTVSSDVAPEPAPASAKKKGGRPRKNP
jgi:hypothetical protein